MTLKEKLEFLAKHSDGSDFEIRYKKSRWFVFSINTITIRIDEIEEHDFREIERKCL